MRVRAGDLAEVSAVVLRGDARSLPLPDESVDLIVTSPPYFGLRDYRDGDASLAGQIGSEATPREYIAALIDCTREWMRVLKPCGSMFVNLGDKYGGTKSLLGLPWRYALACIDQLGLILRAEIIWAKPNGLPESATDRVRRSHEQVFHFTRQPRYYSAVDEIREAHAPGNQARSTPNGMRRGIRDARATEISGGVDNYDGPNPLGKLPGSVWDIPSQPLIVPAHLGLDHFAAFPMELPRRCILGWSPPGVCTACGQGRRPVAERERTFYRFSSTGLYGAEGRADLDSVTRTGRDGRNGGRAATTATITGYACACPQPDAPTRPAVVVDPFGGTGTTALVASVNGRHGITVDRSADYCRLAEWRTRDPGERAKAMRVPKPPPVPVGQGDLFDLEAS